MFLSKLTLAFRAIAFLLFIFLVGIWRFVVVMMNCSSGLLSSRVFKRAFWPAGVIRWAERMRKTAWLFWAGVNLARSIRNLIAGKSMVSFSGTTSLVRLLR